MTHSQSGKANRLPLLGQAIVGAALLVSGDSAEGPQPEPVVEPAPDLARFSVVLDLPEPKFGKSGTATVAVGPSRAAQSRGEGAAEPDAEQVVQTTASLAPPVVEPPVVNPLGPLVATVAGPQAELSPVPRAAPALIEAEPQGGSEATTAPFAAVGKVLDNDPVLSRAGGTGFDRHLQIESLLGEALDPLGAGPAIVRFDTFPVPAFGPPLVAVTGQTAVPGKEREAALVQKPESPQVFSNSAPARADDAPDLAEDQSAGVVANSLPIPRLAVSLPAAAPRPVSTSTSDAPIAAPVTTPAASAHPSPVAPFPPGAEPTLSYDDELIFQIETPKKEMVDTIVAYGTRNGVYMPFGTLTRFLDLSIAVSDDGHYASGWFLSEDRTVTINLREGRIVLSGKSRALESGEAIAFDGELYLRVEDFARIFPLKLTADLRTQLVKVEPLEVFPYEQRLARERARARLAGRKGGSKADDWPREKTPWRAFTPPMTDIELRAASDSSLGSRVEGDLRMAGDLAFMTARTYLSGSTRDGLTGARFELGRRDPDGRLFGPLGATEFQIGDVSTQAQPLGLRGISGRGAAITNVPIDQASLFDSIDLRGELLDGYEVELYRNDILIESTRMPVNGQYEFLQVPVDFGLNVFRLVFFGPQGQRYEEVRRIRVGDGRRKAGEFIYSFGMAQKDVNLLNVRDPFEALPADYGAWRATGSLEYGFTPGLTAQVAGSWFETLDGTSWMASAGLRTGISGMAIKADIGLQKGGGKSAQLGVGGQLFGASYSLTHAEYSGQFIDEVRAFSTDYLDRASELNVNTTLTLGGNDNPVFLPISLRARRLEFAGGRKLTQATVRASTRLGGLMVSKTFDYSSTSSSSGFSSNALVGKFDLSTLAGSRTQYRASVSYALMPSVELRTASVQVDHAIDSRTLASASVSHTFIGSETRVGLAATRRFEHFALSFSGDYAFPSGTYTAALRFGIGFGRNPLTGRFFVDRPGLAAGGALAVRAYHDRNGDNRFDDGDLVLPDIEFGLGGRMVKTDAQGVAMAGGLGDGTRASYRVDMESLPDIALHPRSPGISFVPRAGRVHTSDFAIVALSEVEGTARFVAEGQDKPVSGVQLELVDAEGKVAHSARTEGDGFYLFEQVAPGTYTLRIEPDQSKRLGIALASENVFVIPPEGDVVRRDIAVDRP
ncbi:MAG: hypothetical protein KDE32_15065 [Novosphingobium sp.]|nr:hypothetical protein [Novosphingobium sp.]